jgi:hypothetical protein
MLYSFIGFLVYLALSLQPSVSRLAEAYPASYPLDTGGPYLGGRRGRDVTLTLTPIFWQGLESAGAIPSFPLSSCMVFGRQILFFIS